MAANMVAHGLIKDGYVALVMGAATDIDHAEKLKAICETMTLKRLSGCFRQIKMPKICIKL